jgi:hypothetical protein
LVDLAFRSGIAQFSDVQVLFRIRGVLFAMALLAILASCRTAAQKKGEEATAAAATPSSLDRSPIRLPVGVVHHVDETARFILIRSSKGLQLEPETILTVHGDQGQEIARVKVSPARKESFLTADFLEGVPVKGRQVTMEYESASPERASEPATTVFPDHNAIQILE